MSDLLRLDDISAHDQLFRQDSRVLSESDLGSGGHLFCPICGDFRRVDAALNHELSDGGQRSLENNLPALLSFSCRECRTRFYGMLYAKKLATGELEPDIIVIPEVAGGIRTPNTIPEVAYYLDQAHRSSTIGARSAAVAMYRSAIEMMLFHEGYEMKMLGPKVSALKNDFQGNTGKPWVQQIEPEVIDVLNQLATWAIHPNNGAIERQTAFDKNLLLAIEASIKQLLHEVYERTKEREERTTFLKQKIKDLKSGTNAQETPRS